MYNVSASARPLIAVAGETSEVARVVTEERIGWVTPPEDAAALAATIRTARDARAGLAEMGARAREAAVSKYTRADAVDRYLAIFSATPARDASARI